MPKNKNKISAIINRQEVIFLVIVIWLSYELIYDAFQLRRTTRSGREATKLTYNYEKEAVVAYLRRCHRIPLVEKYHEK